MDDVRNLGRRRWLLMAGFASLASAHAAEAPPANLAEVHLPGQRGGDLVDATVALRRLFEGCIASGTCAVLSGSYLVSGPVADSAIRPEGHLHIRCIGDVVIRVAPSATPFAVLLACYSRLPNHSSISGGRLTLELSGRCASGLLLRHDGPEGGTVHWSGVTVRQAHNLNPADVNENQGIAVSGRYLQIDLTAPRVSGVDRSNVRGGACKGISISEAAGQVTLRNPQVEFVRCTGSAGDADGISVFGHPSRSGVYAWRHADVQILQPVVRDCQGRSIKLQASESLIDRPRIYRQTVGTVGVPDIDFQLGNGVLREPMFDYRLRPDGSNPLHDGFFPISVQQQCTDRPMVTRIEGGVLRAARPMPRLLYLTLGPTDQDSMTVLDGLQCQATDPALAGHFQRALVEFSGAQVERAAGAAALAIRRVRGRFDKVPLLGYTEASERAAHRMDIELSDNHNTTDGGAVPAAVQAVSGPPMAGWRSVSLRGNRGVSEVLSHLKIDLDGLRPGARLLLDLATCRLAGAPAGLPGQGVAQVEVQADAARGAAASVRLEVVDHPAGGFRASRRGRGAWAVLAGP
jgi:hypothetical protein